MRKILEILCSLIFGLGSLIIIGIFISWLLSICLFFLTWGLSIELRSDFNEKFDKREK
jgi:hypothetical protein